MSEQTPEQWARATLERHVKHPSAEFEMCYECGCLWPCQTARGARHVLALTAQEPVMRAAKALVPFWYDEYRGCQYGYCVTCGAGADGTAGQVNITSTQHSLGCEFYALDAALKVYDAALAGEGRE